MAHCCRVPKIVSLLVRNYCSRKVLQQRPWSSSSSNNGVSCNVAVITGGSAGIGLSTAKAFLCKGARAVVVADINKELGEKAVKELSEQFGKNRVTFVETDATKATQMCALFDCTMDRFKTLDIFFNNAGMLSDKHWQDEIALNVTAVTQNLLLAYKYMEGRGGFIINNASILGLQEFHGCPVYCASKHYVIGLTRSFGHEYYEKLTKVKTCAICPGVSVPTRLIEDAQHFALEGFGDVGSILAKGLSDLPEQHTDKVGECIVNIICDGQNGSIWVIEGGECYKVKLPDRLTMRCN